MIFLRQFFLHFLDHIRHFLHNETPFSLVEDSSIFEVQPFGLYAFLNRRSPQFFLGFSSNICLFLQPPLHSNFV